MFSSFLNFSQSYEIANEGLNWPNINDKIQAKVEGVQGLVVDFYLKGHFLKPLNHLAV